MRTILNRDRLTAADHRLNFMDKQRWVQLEDLFHAAKELPSGERDAFVAGRCGTAAELRQTLLSLLHVEGAGMLDPAELNGWNFEKLCNAVNAIHQP